MTPSLKPSEVLEKGSAPGVCPDATGLRPTTSGAEPSGAWFPVDHHGIQVVLFDGTNAEAVAEYILRSMDLCPQRSCAGCPVGCADETEQPQDPARLAAPSTGDKGTTK